MQSVVLSHFKLNLLKKSVKIAKFSPVQAGLFHENELTGVNGRFPQFCLSTAPKIVEKKYQQHRAS
jgi:hypothetical protein